MDASARMLMQPISPAMFGWGSAAIVGGWFLGLMGDNPLWLVLGCLVLLLVSFRASVHRWLGGPDLDGRVGLRLGVVAVPLIGIVYVTGFGPALLLIWSRVFSRLGWLGLHPTRWRTAWAWCVGLVLLGQILIAVGVLRCVVPSPAVHVVAAISCVLAVRMHRGLDGMFQEVIAKSAEAELARAKREGNIRLTQALIAHSADVLLTFDEQGRTTWVGTSIEEVLGYTAQSRVGRPGLEGVHPDDVPHVLAIVDQAMACPGEFFRHEVRMLHADGTFRWHAAQLQNLFDDPAVRSLVVAHHDITDRKELEERLRHQAFHDALTGLPNRALFFERIAEQLDTTDGRSTAVVVVDLDDFKDVNDTLGHLAGDELLRQVAVVLSGCVREGDIVARLGGDEFALLLVDVDDAVAVASAVAERVLRLLREGVAGSVITTASIGIATTPVGPCDSRELMNHADLAMYAAKQRGKGRCAVYDRTMSVDHFARLELADDLAQALATGEGLHVAYQPVVDLRTGRVRGVEALARWDHSEKGSIPPGTFIPVAEANGMVVPLGLRVLREVCRTGADWRAGNPHLADLVLSVNLSARQLESPTLLDDVDAALRDSGLPAANLQLEVTETVLVDDAEAAARVLRDLKARGLRLALDDFGTGYSSLRYLNQFPLDVVKIDRSFVTDVHLDPQRAMIVETVVALAHGMGLVTIAEGIEQPGEREFLLALGCQEGQGYLFARPQPPDRVIALLARTSLMTV